MQHYVIRGADMPVDLKGVQFYTMSEVADVVGAVRQTVWRWAKANKIPVGRRYRGRERLFTLEEMQEIYAYAHRLEPEVAGQEVQNQLTLFARQ